MQNYEEAPKNAYGIFELKDSGLECEILEFKIQVNSIGNDKYSYSRSSSEANVVSKVFTSKTKDVKIEIAPILPQNLPDKVTNFTMLKFNETLQIEKQSSTKFDVVYPTEIGVFAVFGEGNRTLIECFSGDPSASRYGMYGSPEEGVLCKCFRVSFGDKEKHNPFLNSKISINFQNETESDVSLSKLVFLSTNHDVFYKSNEVITEGINCVIKETLGNKFAEINPQTTESPSGLTVSPRLEQKTSNQFTMDKGFT